MCCIVLIVFASIKEMEAFNAFHETVFIECLTLPRRGDDFILIVGTVHDCIDPRG